MYVYILYVYNNILGIEYKNDNGNTLALLPLRAQKKKKIHRAPAVER